MANLALMQRIANEVETLISQNPKAVERFREQLKVFNDAWRKYWSAQDKVLPILYQRPDKSIEDAYEYDSHFKCWFPKDTPTLPPDPTKWELNDKYPCYYGTLAVIYDLEKGKYAPSRLCEGILDNYGFAMMQICISRAWGYDKDMLDTALKWVKEDINKTQEKNKQRKNWHNEDFTEVSWNGKKYKFNKPQQALSVKYLWENKRGREKSIGEAIGSEADNFRLIHIFRQQGKKTKMHPAWGTMIVPDGKGIFALAECKKAPKK